MKVVASIVAVGVSLSSLLCAQSPKPFKTVNLNKVKVAGLQCEIKFQDDLSRVLWLDEKHLALSSFTVRRPDVLHSYPDAAGVIVLDDAGSILSAARRSDVEYFSRGPRGMIAGLRSGKIELLDDQLHPQQSLECPNSSKFCGISLVPRAGIDSEFAVCSSVADARQICDLYRGWPAIRVSSNTFSQTEVPYTPFITVPQNAAWHVSAGEIWFFSDGRLMRSEPDKVSSPVNPEDFVGKNGGNCEGALSDLEPRRFLALCTGTHWYSDGMFDAIFGFTRVVLFEAPSGCIIQRFDGPAYISAALSPSGKKVAILRSGRVLLYEVD